MKETKKRTNGLKLVSDNKNPRNRDLSRTELIEEFADRFIDVANELAKDERTTVGGVYTALIYAAARYDAYRFFLDSEFPDEMTLIYEEELASSTSLYATCLSKHVQDFQSNFDEWKAREEVDE